MELKRSEPMPEAAIIPVSPDRAAFDACAAQACSTVARSSGRVYEATYRAWQTYAAAAGISPLALTYAHVDAFLAGQTVAKSTRQLKLSALRKAVQMLYIATGDPAAERMHKALGMLRARDPETARPERQRRALSPGQVTRVLDAWNGNTPIALRNRALMELLFFAGPRRAELAALRWQDVDLDEGTITIRHGKGDKRRTASIAGESAISALQAWRSANPGEYVFPAAWKDGRMRADQPISADGIYRIVKQTELRAGVEFRPHDARRTHITEALATGTPLADMQAQAGHAQASTTLRYAQPVDARERRTRMHLRYS